MAACWVEAAYQESVAKIAVVVVVVVAYQVALVDSQQEGRVAFRLWGYSDAFVIVQGDIQVETDMIGQTLKLAHLYHDTHDV